MTMVGERKAHTLTIISHACVLYLLYVLEVPTSDYIGLENLGTEEVNKPSWVLEVSTE